MNYAVLMFGTVIIFAGLYYAIVGRRRFNPPIRKEEYL